MFQCPEIFLHIHVCSCFHNENSHYMYVTVNNLYNSIKLDGGHHNEFVNYIFIVDFFFRVDVFSGIKNVFCGKRALNWKENYESYYVIQVSV